MVSSVIMIAFVLSGTVIKPNMSEMYTKIPATYPEVPRRSDCAQSDGDFEACVTGQQRGSGCSWYAACNKCIPDADKDDIAICN